MKKSNSIQIQRVWIFLLLTTLVSCTSTDITSVKITATKVEVEAGKTLQLTVTVDGNSEINEKDKEVKWKSNNIEVASVDQNGLVNSKKAGMAEIIAISKTDDGKIGTFQLTVFNKSITSIKLELDKNTVEVGENAQLILTVNGEHLETEDKQVNLENSNESVASVNQNGLITGKKAGKTTITATSKLDESKTATIEVTVFEKAIDKVKVEPEFSNIEVGKSKQLTITITGNNLEPNDKQINWHSSDSTIASVDQTGLVKAQSQGNATITATSELDNTKTATAEVTVFEQEVVFVTIELAIGEIKVGKTIQLSAQVEGNNLETADKEVWWQSSDILVASIDQSGLATGKKPGTTTITATSKLNSSKKTTVEITVTEP